jgi:hypothetical protein
MTNVRLEAVGKCGDLRLIATLGDGSSWHSGGRVRRNKPSRLPELARRCQSYDWPLASAGLMEAAFTAFRKTLPNAGHIPRGPRKLTIGKMPLVHQNGKCWHGTLDLTELKRQGFVVYRGFLEKGGTLVRALHDEATRQPLKSRVHAGVAPNQAKVSELFAKGTVLDKKGKNVAQVASESLQLLLPDVEAHCCEKTGLGGYNTSEFITGTPGTDKGIVHGDTASPESSVAAVIILNPEGGVGPFFVGGEPPRTKRATYKSVKADRWRRVEDNAKDKSKILSMVGSSGAHWDPPVEVSAAGRPSRKGPAARPMLEQGDAVFFDSTSPHAAPGTLQSEPKRVVMYLAFHSAQVALHTVVSSAVHAVAQKQPNSMAIPTVSASDYIRVLK